MKVSIIPYCNYSLVATAFLILWCFNDLITLGNRFCNPNRFFSHSIKSIKKCYILHIHFHMHYQLYCRYHDYISNLYNGYFTNHIQDHIYGHIYIVMWRMKLPLWYCTNNHTCHADRWTCCRRWQSNPESVTRVALNDVHISVRGVFVFALHFTGSWVESNGEERQRRRRVLTGVVYHRIHICTWMFCCARAHHHMWRLSCPQTHASANEAKRAKQNIFWYRKTSIIHTINMLF